MNGLALRIGGGSKSRAPPSALPPLLLMPDQLAYFKESDTKFNKFNQSSSADQQLAALKEILNAEVITEDVAKFLAVVFLTAELKHPIKSYLARHITKTTSIQRLFQRHLKEELINKISANKNNDITTISETVSAVLSCTENFPSGSAALENCEAEWMFYLKKVLLGNLQLLKSNTSLSPTDKNHIFNLTHNVLRAFLKIYQLYSNGDITAHVPSFSLTVVHESIDSLMAESEVPMDTKSLGAILKVTMYSLERGRDYWTKYLAELQETPCEDTNAAIRTVCAYSALITVVPVRSLEMTEVCGTSALVTLAENVLKISERFSVEPLVALCVARTLLSMTKALQRSEGTAEGISASVSVLSFVWAHVEHFMDSVRHLASQVLSNVLKYFGRHQNSGFPKVFDVFFSELITLPPNKKAYYVGLSASASVLGTQAILERIPKLISRLIVALSNQAMQANVATAMETLLQKHIQEVKTEQVYDCWIRPILARVYASAQSPGAVDTTTLNILENVISKAVKWDGKIMNFILPEAKMTCASPTISVGDLKCVLVCLNLARRMGALDDVTSQDCRKWKEILSYDVIKTAMTNSSEEIRILALSLLIETSKSTEPFVQLEFDLFLLFLEYNINTQAPNLRHLTLSLVKKLMKRLESSYKVLKRQNNAPNTKNTGPTPEMYEDFLLALRAQCYDSLLPHANYSRRAIALQILVWCEELDLESYQSYWCEEYVEKLQLHFEDSYENNKMLTLDVLGHCPIEYFKSESMRSFLRDAIEQASSVKPPDCVSAAYKLQLIQRIYDRLPYSLMKSELISASSERATYGLVSLLLTRLKKELAAARDSVLVAASTAPMYGLVFCARHLLVHADARKLASDVAWSAMIADLIRTCMEVTAVVAPVVNNSSPEGHLPMDGEPGAAHLAGNGLTLEDGTRVTAQMVLLCAWRSVKEVSLLLGDISSSLYIRGECKEDGSTGNLSREDMRLMGDHFTTLLAETKHRGAFEQAYVGFTKLCARLWKCGSAELHGLPRAWLAGLMDAIASGDRGGKLCSTRRSAGVPFMIQALVTTELQEVGNPKCFHECMATLFHLASFQCTGDVTVETRTHCLNILRALFRHTALGEVVNSYVGSGLVTAIRGFDGTTWAERNSSTLLFSSLMVRIFGVQRSKDSDRLCIRNKMTGRTFFLRYPRLYDFMLEKLQEVASCEDSRDLLHPSLYPVLLLLARLYPYSLEESSTNLKLVAFIPHVQSCGGSCVLKTRQLAAKAIVPLISHDKYIFHINELLKLLENRKIKRNFCHGILLQLVRLLEWRPENLRVDQSSYSELNESLTGTFWMLEEVLGHRPCYVTADEYVKLLNLMLWRFPAAVEMNKFTEKIQTVLERLCTSKLQADYYGRDVFLANAFNLYILLLLKVDQEATPQVVVNNLNHESYDVVRSALNFILLLHKEIDQESSCRFEEHMREMIDDEMRKEMLKKLEQCEGFTKALFHIVEHKTYLECTQKALTVLSHHDDTQAGLLCLTNQNYVNPDIVIVKLLEKIQTEHENVSHIFIVSLHGYVEKILRSDTIIEENLWIEIVKMLYESCSSENNYCKRRNVVQFLDDNSLRFIRMKFRKLSSDELFVFHTTIWATIVMLLEDDEENLRQRTSSLVLKLAHSMKIHIDEVHEVIPSRASVILLDIIEKFHTENDAIAVFMILALLDFNSEVCIGDDITDQCRVFDQNEKYNIFLEESSWTKECVVRIRQIFRYIDSEYDGIQSILSVINRGSYGSGFQQLCPLNYKAFVKLLSNVDNETVNPKIRLCIRMLNE